ncbi:unnamed protein product [Discula destructiva]
MYQDKTDPASDKLKTRQSGRPFLATGNSTTSTFRQIEEDYISKFVMEQIPAGFKRFPIKCTNAAPMSFAEVKKTYGGPMSTARAKNKVIKNPSLDNSPERKGTKAAKVEAPPAAATGSRSSSLVKAAAGTPDASLSVRPKP